MCDPTIFICQSKDSWSSLLEYGGHHEMPQKACERGFFTWYHFLNFLKCPKFEEFHFRFLSCFKIDHVLISWNTPLLMFEFFEMPNFCGNVDICISIRFGERPCTISADCNLGIFCEVRLGGRSMFGRRRRCCRFGSRLPIRHSSAGVIEKLVSGSLKKFWWDE